MVKKLTLKQENFVIEYMLNGGNATQAYKIAYNCTKMLEATIGNNAYKLLQKNEIITNIEQRKAKHAETFNKSQVDFLKQYEEIADNSNDDRIKIDCYKEQAKLLGYYVEKRETKNTNEFIISGKTIKDIKELQNRVQNMLSQNDIITIEGCVTEQIEDKTEENE